MALGRKLAPQGAEASLSAEDSIRTRITVRSHPARAETLILQLIPIFATSRRGVRGGAIVVSRSTVASTVRSDGEHRERKQP